MGLFEMKAILISIHPKWIAKILNGEKTLEIRKTAPKCDLPIDVYIYCTKTIKPISDYDWGEFTFDDLPKLGKVVAKFTLREIYVYDIKDKDTWHDDGFAETMQKYASLSLCELHGYVGDKKFYAWHISDLQIFNEPKPLSDFKEDFQSWAKRTDPRPPQSWCYVEAGE